MSTFVKDTALKEEFNKYVRKHHIYPPCYSTTTTTTTKSDDDVKEVFGLFFAFVSWLVGPDGNEPDEIQRYITLFLTKVHLVDKNLPKHAANIPIPINSKKKQKGPRQPILCKTHNFITMLNFPREISKFNHLRYMWESVGGGGGYIPILKNFIYDLRKKVIPMH